MADRPADARATLARFENSWLYHHEKDAAKRLAEVGTDDECQTEVERLSRLCKSRLEQWRWSQ